MNFITADLLVCELLSRVYKVDDNNSNFLPSFITVIIDDTKMRTILTIQPN